MDKFVPIFKQCPLCHGVLKRYWPKAHFDICFSCSLLVRNPPPSTDDLEGFYSESWVTPTANEKGTGATDAQLATLFAHRLTNELNRVDLKGMRILDYGAGRGELARALATSGADVYAVEPFGYQYLVENNFKAYPSLDALPNTLLFDGIVTVDVVEHLSAPWEDLTRLYHLLKPSGWIYVATPNAGGISAKVKRSGWDQAHNPGHLYLFAAPSMEQMLLRSGFIDVQQVRWFVKYSNNPAKVGLHVVLQSLLLDGELRYLAFKKAT